MQQNLENIAEATLGDNEFLMRANQISEAFGRLMDWFKKAFPHAYIRLDVNADRRYGHIKYTLVVMTEEEATPLNRGMLKKEWIFNADDFGNPMKVNIFCRRMDEEAPAMITKAMNTHFQHERDRVGNVKLH